MSEIFADANASDSSPDSSSGFPTGTQPAEAANNTGQPDGNQDAQVPFHQHPRWQEMQQHLRASRAEAQQLKQQMEQMGQHVRNMGRQPPGVAAPPLPDDIRNAGDAIWQIMGQHPSFAKLLATQQFPEQFGTQMEAWQTEQAEAAKAATVDASRNLIVDLAQRDGMKLTPETLSYYEELVTAVIRQNPEWHFRLVNRGDHRVVEQAFRKVTNEVIAQLGRPQAAASAAAKANTLRLPPAARGGGLPGAASAPKIDPSSPRAFEKGLESLANRASAELGRLMG